MNLVVYFRWPYCGTVTQSIYYAYFTSYLSSKLTYSFFFAAGFNSFASRSAKLSPLLSNYQNPTVIFDWYGVATEAVIGAVSRAGRQSHRLQDGERGIPLILHTLYGNTTEYFSDLPSTLPIIKKKQYEWRWQNPFPVQATQGWLIGAQSSLFPGDEAARSRTHFVWSILWVFIDFLQRWVKPIGLPIVMLSNGKESSTITARVTASDRHDKGKWLTEFRFWTTMNIFRVKKMAGFCTDSSDYDYRGTRHNR